MSLEGILRNYKRKKITFFTNDLGIPASDSEARKYIAECLAKGWRVILMGSDPCPGFDYQKGCPGHITNIEFSASEFGSENKSNFTQIKTL